MMNSFSQGLKEAETIRETPKYIVFAIITVFIFDHFSGWISVFFFVLGFVLIDALLYLREGIKDK